MKISRITVAAVAALSVALLAGCTQKEKIYSGREVPDSISQPEPASLVERPEGGSWARLPEGVELPFPDAVVAEDTSLTYERKRIFKQAINTVYGTRYTPVAYLSSQERGWIIHCYLAQAEAVVPDPVPYYALVWVFEDAHGNIAFYGVKEIGETRDGLVDGGWATAKDPTVNEELTAMYDKAFEGFTGAAHEPIALLSTQVVAGTNYCFLARSCGVYPGAEPYYSLVYVYEDLEGNCEVTAIEEVDVAAFIVYFG